MAWTAFSAEACELDIAVRKLHREGRISDVLTVIKQALDKAHREGPSTMTYEEYEAWAQQQGEKTDA